jgi:hypothetical protein
MAQDAVGIIKINVLSKLFGRRLAHEGVVATALLEAF